MNIYGRKSEKETINNIKMEKEKEDDQFTELVFILIIFIILDNK